MMRIYFYDSTNRYVGSRDLRDGEELPKTATTIPLDIQENQEAFFVNDKWEVKNIVKEVVQDIPQEPTTEERIKQLEQCISDLAQRALLKEDYDTFVAEKTLITKA